ncbi:MAG: tetratricopeptide repeat protein [Saprospiraceae bacterium]|nr:tetratricopeptide repeat protein [Saprospiraceae bacterium]
MTERTRLSSSLLNLITDFEQSLTDGINTALDERAYAQIVEYYESENRQDRAVEVVDRAINQFPLNIEFHKLKASLLIKSRRFDDAHKTLSSAEVKEPFNVDLLLLRARVLAGQNKFDQAFDIVDDVKSYVDKDDEIKAFLTEAEVADLSQDYEQMFQALKNALIVDPENINALDLMKKAVNLSRQHFEESILIHTVIVENHPYCAKAWYNLGHSYAFVSEYENAVEALEYAFLVDSTFEEAYNDCAEFCMEISEFQRAEIILHEAMMQFEYNYDSLYNLALCQYHIGKIEESKRTLFEAMQLEPYCEELHFLMAKCDIKDGNWMGAIQMLEKAIDLEDQIEDYYFHLGQVYEKINKEAKANVFYRKAAFQGEEQSYYWEEYILFLIRKGDLEDADKYIKISGEYTYSTRIGYLDVVIKLLNGDRKKGIELFTELIQEDFDSKEILVRADESLKSDKEILSIIKYYEKE